MIPAWPALVALGFVVALAMSGLVVDLAVERQTAERTDQLFDNASRSRDPRVVAEIGRAIRSDEHDELAIDALTAAIIAVLAIGVAVVLVRVLRHQRELVVARHRELEAFAGRVAHDLRGPLAPLTGYADLLELGAGPPPLEIGRRIR